MAESRTISNVALVGAVGAHNSSEGVDSSTYDVLEWSQVVSGSVILCGTLKVGCRRLGLFVSE